MRTARESEALVADVRGAAERGELVLHYQPIVELRGGACRRVEALVRWRHPRFGLVMPSELLPAAERACELTALASWSVAEAIRQSAEWRDQGLPLGVAVNLSIAQLVSERLADRTLELLRVRGLRPESITFEIAAGALLAAEDEAREAVAALGRAGIRVSLDDATAADVPARAGRAHLDELKVARSQVRSAVADASARTGIRAQIELARDLGLALVAVGVEDRATYELVARLGCDAAQGYWMSRPLLPHDHRWRRWAMGIAFGSALALFGQVTAARGASPGGAHDGAAPAEVRGFLPSLCVLDTPLPYGARSGADAITPAEVTRATGVAVVEITTSRADLIVESTLGPPDRRRIADALERDIPAVERDLGVAFQRRPTVYVFADRAGFARGLERVFGVSGATAGLLASANGGATVPRADAIVLSWQGFSSDPALAIVRHELTHALVHATIGPTAAPPPAWFDEGMATLEERTLRPETEDRDAAVALALLAEGRASLGSLAAGDTWALRNAELDGQGYAVAAEAARLVRERIAPGSLATLLQRVGEGTPFSRAYAEAAGETLEDFVSAFPARLATDRGAPRVAQRADAGYVRFTLLGFVPASTVAVSIDGGGYHLTFDVTADRYGMYEGTFGPTAPPGDYVLTATGRGGSASGTLRNVAGRAGGQGR